MDKCKFCNNTGIAEYLDFTIGIPDGIYFLNDLLVAGQCPECNQEDK